MREAFFWMFAVAAWAVRGTLPAASFPRIIKLAREWPAREICSGTLRTWHPVLHRRPQALTSRRRAATRRRGPAARAPRTRRSSRPLAPRRSFIPRPVLLFYLEPRRFAALGSLSGRSALSSARFAYMLAASERRLESKKTAASFPSRRSRDRNQTSAGSTRTALSARSLERTRGRGDRAHPHMPTGRIFFASDRRRGRDCSRERVGGGEGLVGWPPFSSSRRRRNVWKTQDACR